MIKFTIVTVAKNAAATIGKCIASVEAQQYPAIEYIVVDGASTDGTLSIVERHKGTISTLISEPDTGIYNAMNKGLKAATGDFIYFIGADDFLVDATILSDVARFLDRNSDCGFAYGSILVRWAKRSPQIFTPPPPEDALAWLVAQCLPHQASFTSRRTFDIVGPFDERYRIAGDYEWFLRVAGNPTITVKRIDRVIASYFYGGLSTDLARSQKEAYEAQNNFPLFQTAPWLERRLLIFQEELLKLRIEADQLRAKTVFSQLIDKIFLTPPKDLPGRISRYVGRRLRASQQR